MMKLAIVVSAVLVFQCVVVRCGNDDQMVKMIDSCKTEEKATDNDITNWQNDIKPKPRISKCLDACVGAKLGMYTDNKLNVDAVMKIIEKEIKDEKKTADYKAIVDECKTKTDVDRCEACEIILNCLKDAASKRGLKEIF